MNNKFKVSCLRSANVVKGLALLVMLFFSLPSYSVENSHKANQTRVWFGQTLQVDVAEDHTRFSFDEAPVFDNGGPKAGNAFVTHGYIYQKGFFDLYAEGVDKRGQPIRPDLVIGEWTCRGNFVGDGMNTKTGPWIISIQTFDFYDKPGYHKNQNRLFGKRMVSTEGYELVDVNKIVKRAITGGTGRYSTTKGEHKQNSLGLGQFGGAKAVHVLKLQRL